MGVTSGCGEKTCAPDAANYQIGLASPLSFSSDLVREVHARGHISVLRVSLYGLLGHRFLEKIQNGGERFTLD